MYEILQPLGIPIPSWKKIYETSPCVSAFLGPLYFTFGWMVELVFATKTSRLLLLSGHRCRDSAPPSPTIYWFFFLMEKSVDPRIPTTHEWWITTCLHKQFYVSPRINNHLILPYLVYLGTTMYVLYLVPSTTIWTLQNSQVYAWYNDPANCHTFGIRKENPCSSF